MNKGRVLVLVGSILLILGGFLPWTSVPNLFGLEGSTYEAIEFGWEGDGVLTTDVGLVLLLSEIIFGAEPYRWYRWAGIILAALAASVVFLDFGRILEIAPEAGFFAATDYGIFVTLVGALLALVGCLWKRVPSSRRQRTMSPEKMV